MRKILVGILLLSFLFCLVGCGEIINNHEQNDVSQYTEVTEQKDDIINQFTEKPEESNKKITPSELESELSKQEVRITSTKYYVQHEEYKSLYPDILQAIIQNDSKYDIKNAVVAFVAWDENNLPVKIEGNFDLGDKSYIKRCNFNDINLVPGKTYGEDSGMALASDTDNIKKFKAVVVSYETFDGETWNNPLYKTWVELYEGKRYSK